MDKRVVIAGGAAVALAAVGVGASYVAGTKAEQALQAETAAWAQALPFVKVLDQTYDRGVFGATRTVRLQLGCGMPAAEGRPASPGPVVLVLHDRIQHGPLPGLRHLGAAAIDTEVTLDEPQRAAVQKALGTELKPITVHTLAGFGGGFSSDFEVPQLVVNVTPQQAFNFSGLQGHMEKSGRTVRYEARMPSFEMKDETTGMTMKVAAIAVRGEGEQAGELAWMVLGKGSADIGTLEMVVPPKEGSAPMRVRFADMKSSSDASVDKDLLTSKMSFTGSGQIADMKIDSIDAQVSVKRIHLPSYQKIIGQALGAATCGPAADADPAAAAQMQMAAIQGMFAALLPHDPEYSLDHLKATIAGKEGSIAYSFGSKGIVAQDLENPNLPALLPKLVLKANASIPVAWVEAVVAAAATHQDPNAALPPPGAMDPAIDQLVQKGLVRREADVLVGQMEFSGGALTVNGRPMPLPIAGMAPADPNAPR